MITEIEISNFRGVREGRLSALTPVSVLVGPNNSGKSTALEALFVVANELNAHGTMRVLLGRGGPEREAVRRIVRQGAEFARFLVDSRQSFFLMPQYSGIELQMANDNPPPKTPSHSYATARASSNGSGTGWNSIAPTAFVTVANPTMSLEDAYTEIENARELNSVVAALARSMPGLVDLRILKDEEGDFLLHTYVGANEAPVPAFVAGDGLKRFLQMAASIYSAKSGVAIVEEPEAFQHPRYMRELVDIIFLAAQKNTQIVMSTHSIELLDAILAHKSAETLASVHRMRLVDGVLASTPISGASAKTLRADLEQDLRS